MFIFLYVLSFAICSLDFDGINGPIKADNIPDIHCGIDLTNFIPSENRSSCIINLTSCVALASNIMEPYFPILSYPIFKPPKPAKIFHFV